MHTTTLEPFTASNSPAHFVENVVPALLNWRREGLKTALVTLVDVDGSSPRPVGSQMAVNERGGWLGNITSGCAEAAIVQETVRAIDQRQAKLERYGKGSRYLDIQLPCGSGIDVFFDPHVPIELLEQVADATNRRHPIGLSFNLDPTAPGRHAVEPMLMFGPHDERKLKYKPGLVGGRFTRPFTPSIRVGMAGRGPIMRALAQMADALDWSVVTTSPDEETIAALRPFAEQSTYIAMPNKFDPRLIDGWTASVLLFHDHEWEPAILKRVLDSGGFYVGALGSRRTHELRCAALADLGCTPHQIEQIRGPIGLDIGAKSPPEIALAIAGEILATARGDCWATGEKRR